MARFSRVSDHTCHLAALFYYILMYLFIVNINSSVSVEFSRLRRVSQGSLLGPTLL